MQSSVDVNWITYEYVLSLIRIDAITTTFGRVHYETGCPPTERTDRKADRRKSNGRPNVWFHVGQVQTIFGDRGRSDLHHVLGLSSFRLFQKDEQGQNRKDAHQRSDTKRIVPTAEQCGHLRSDDVAESGSDWNGKIEESQHFGTHFFGVQISDDGRSKCRVAGLTDTDQTAKQKEEVGMIGRHERAEKGGRTPEKNAKRHYVFSVVSIAPVAEQRRKNHVRNDERRLNQSFFRFIEIVVFADRI